MAGGSSANKDVDLDYVGIEADEEESNDDWLRRAQQAYSFSTTYVDSNYRKTWEDSIRAFNNQHALDSKYNDPAYSKRSRLYRPKTRAIIRKNEAAAAAAFFSNMDVVSCTAQKQSDQKQTISAEIMKELLTYRLSKSIPWFQTVLGGLQDAQTQGAVCGHVYWDYKTKESKDADIQANQPEYILVDKPCIDLIPLENIRIDSAALWTDPINSSPYVIHLMPMYVGDIKERMKRADKRGKKWYSYSDGTIRRATQSKSDSTRSARNNNKEDPYDQDGKSVSDYEIAWVQRHIHRLEGEDWEFYTLGTEALLSKPELLKETVFHGIRPYVLGVSILETHKIIPSSVPTLSAGLQAEANEIVNQRLDNVKFVLNKAYMVKRGKNVDVAALVRNAPGKVVMMDDPVNDVKESVWPDVTASAYQEQDRVNLDMDELLGNFSPAGLPNRKAGETVRGMAMLAQPANMLTEYMLRTYVETFVEPVLRHLVKLEQAYETDQVVLAIAVEGSEAFQKYGIDQVTDDLLNQELTIKVNVGMGATDPQSKLQKFILGMQSFSGIAKDQTPGLNLQEVGKEIFGHLGYQDGKRFFVNANPEVAKLQQQIQQMSQMLQAAGMKIKDKTEDRQVKVLNAREKNVKDIIVQKMKHHHEDRHVIAGHIIELAKPVKVEKQNGARPRKS